MSKYFVLKKYQKNIICEEVLEIIFIILTIQWLNVV